MSLSITDIIKQTQLVYGMDDWRPPDLVRLQDQVVQYQQRKWDNEHLILRQRHFDKSPSVSTPTTGWTVRTTTPGSPGARGRSTKSTSTPSRRRYA